MLMQDISEPTFSDSALGEVQRLLAKLPEPPLVRREPSGRLQRMPQPRRLVIVDGDKLHRLMLARGLDVASLSVAAGLWAAKPGRKLVQQALDYGELNPGFAAKVASALGCRVEDFSMGIRAVTVEPGAPRVYNRRRRN